MTLPPPSWISLHPGIIGVACFLFGGLMGWVFGYQAGRQDAMLSRKDDDLVGDSEAEDRIKVE